MIRGNEDYCILSHIEDIYYQMGKTKIKLLVFVVAENLFTIK